MTPLNQFRQIFSGAAHVQKDQAQLRLFTRECSKNSFLTYLHQDNISLLTFDINLLK